MLLPLSVFECDQFSHGMSCVISHLSDFVCCFHEHGDIWHRRVSTSVDIFTYVQQNGWKFVCILKFAYNYFFHFSSLHQSKQNVQVHLHRRGHMMRYYWSTGVDLCVYNDINQWSNSCLGTMPEKQLPQTSLICDSRKRHARHTCLMVINAPAIRCEMPVCYRSIVHLLVLKFTWHTCFINLHAWIPEEWSSIAFIGSLNHQNDSIGHFGNKTKGEG